MRLIPKEGSHEFVGQKVLIADSRVFTSTGMYTFKSITPVLRAARRLRAFTGQRAVVIIGDVDSVYVMLSPHASNTEKSHSKPS